MLYDGETGSPEVRPDPPCALGRVYVQEWTASVTLWNRHTETYQSCYWSLIGSFYRKTHTVTAAVLRCVCFMIFTVFVLPDFVLDCRMFLHVVTLNKHNQQILHTYIKFIVIIITLNSPTGCFLFVLVHVDVWPKPCFHGIIFATYSPDLDHTCYQVMLMTLSLINMKLSCWIIRTKDVQLCWKICFFDKKAKLQETCGLKREVNYDSQGAFH